MVKNSGPDGPHWKYGAHVARACPICGQIGKRRPGAMCKPCNLARRGGSLNPRWRGGITPINQQIRASQEYKAWRVAVFERDAYTCQHCGQVGWELHADHIEPFSVRPDLRFELSNGRTLCRKCHMKTPSYLGGARHLQRLAKLAARQLRLFP
jgi:5-methylcytosine-specific restriction endonuclease McrA